MRKLMFVSVAGLGLVGMSEDVYGMFDFFRGRQEAPQNTDSRAVVTQAELSEKRRLEEGHKDDVMNVTEMVNNQISDLTRLTMLVQNLSDKVTTLTEQNESLRAKNDALKEEKSALNQQIADFKNSTEQKLLEETKRANDLKLQELAEAKRLAADKLAKNKKLTEELIKLAKERDDWAGYLDGRRWNSVPRNIFGKACNEFELKQYLDGKAKAPGKIAEIDRRMDTLRAQFEKY